MLLHEKKIFHLNCLTHDGKVILLGIDDQQTLHYSIRQSGFEDTTLADNSNDTGFEEWRKLALARATYDASHVAYMQKHFSDDQGSPLLRVRYGLDSNGAEDQDVTESYVTTPRMVSAMGSLYVFRFSKQNTLLVNRFVLTNFIRRPSE